MVRFCLIEPLLKLKSTYYTLQLSEIQFFLLVLSTVMIAAAGYIINDYFDVKIDKVNKPERLVIDKGIKRRVAIGAHTVINILAIAIAMYVSYSIGFWKLALIHFICTAGLWFYSTTFKRQFLIGNIVIALFTALVPLIVGVYELFVCYKSYLPLDEQLSFKLIWYWILAISFFAFITTLLREIIKDIEDYEGDKEYGCYTMPIAIGINTSKWIIVGLSLATMSCIAMLQIQQWYGNDSFSFYYFLIAIQLPFFFLIFKTVSAKDKKDYRLAGNTAKFIMFMGVNFLWIVRFLL